MSTNRLMQRYTLDPYAMENGIVELELPQNSIMRAVQLYRGTPSIWVEVNTAGKPTTYRIHVVAMNQALPEEPVQYLGMLQLYNDAIPLHFYKELQTVSDLEEVDESEFALI